MKSKLSMEQKKTCQVAPVTLQKDTNFKSKFQETNDLTH